MSSTSDFSTEYWIYFIILLTAWAFIDRYVISKNSLKLKENLYSVIFWMILSVFCCFVLKFLWLQKFVAKDHSIDFLTAYLIELSLSIDNVFVFIMIFEKLKISEKNNI